MKNIKGALNTPFNEQVKNKRSNMALEMNKISIG